jgi:uncharacterized protein
MSIDGNERLQKIADFVRPRLQAMYARRPDRADLDRLLLHAEYRWQHTLRVAGYGRQIAAAEGADLELTVAGCLLHDVAWFDEMADNRDHGRAGAEIARPFLTELGYTPAQAENICHSVATHVDIENPDTLEARITSDADNIERFGAYRILQWCLPDAGDYAALAEKLANRLPRLKRYQEKVPLFTETAKGIFAGQLELQILFFEKIVQEHQGCALPRL